MRMNELARITKRPKKRIGRGIGSGKGKTSGRGTKGQKARGKIPATFTGSLALYKKLPLKRGKGNRKSSGDIKTIKLSRFAIFKANEVIDIEKLVSAHLISGKDAKNGVKILGGGELKHGLIINLPVSAAARRQILKTGGKVMDD